MEITNSSPWEMTHPHLILVTIIIYSRHGKKHVPKRMSFHGAIGGYIVYLFEYIKNFTQK